MLTKYDKALFAFFTLIATLSLAFNVYWTWPTSSPKQVVVTGVRGQIASMPLDGPAKIVKARGPIGTTVIQVANGKVKVVSSPCKRKICIAQGSISKPNESIVCAPNKVVISIASNEAPELDAVVQ